MVLAIKRKKNILYSSFIIMLLLLFLLISIQDHSIFGNPIYIGGDRFDVGGLLPSNTSYNLNMKNATVLMDINATEFDERIHVRFYGSYNIFNPNETIALMIGAPFTTEITPPEYYVEMDNYQLQINESLQILVNDIKVPFSFTLLENISGWENYLYNYDYFRVFAIANITFAGYTTTNLVYTWNATLELTGSSNYAVFYYDVATARSWEGNLTETVTCKVLGYQPDSYTDYKYGELSKHCIITDFEGGKNYSWIWENERIIDFYVGVSYALEGSSYFNPINFLIIIITIPTSLIILVPILFYLIKKLRKKRNSKS